MTNSEQVQNRRQQDEELRRRVHFIQQCGEMEDDVALATKHLKREDPQDAIAALRGLRGRLDGVLEDMEDYYGHE
jgi:hypothetical protein